MNKLDENIKVSSKKSEENEDDLVVYGVYQIVKGSVVSNKDPEYTDTQELEDNARIEVRGEVLSAVASFFEDFECPKTRLAGFNLVFDMHMHSPNLLIGSDEAINAITQVLENYEAMFKENQRLKTLISIKSGQNI